MGARLARLGLAMAIAALMTLPVSAASSASPGSPSPLSASRGPPTAGCATPGACSSLGPRPLHLPSAGAGPAVLRPSGGPSPTGPGSDGILASVSLANDSLRPSIQPVSPGTGPINVAFDSGRQLVFVVESNRNEVSVYDANLTHLMATVLVGSNPSSIVYAPGAGEVLVANYGSNTVTVINDTTFAPVVSLPIGSTSGFNASGPSGLTYNAARHSVFVTSFGHYLLPRPIDNLSEIDPSRNLVVGRVVVGADPVDVQFDPAANSMFVENEIAGTVTVVNATNLDPFSNLSLSFTPTTGVADPNDGAFVAEGVNNTGVTQVAGFRDRSLALLYQLSKSWSYVGLGSLSYDPDDSAVLAAVGSAVQALVPTTGASLGTVATGICAFGDAFAPGPAVEYVTDSCADRTVSLGAFTFGATAAVRSGGQPTALYNDPASGRVWVNDLFGHSVQVLNGSNLSSGLVVWSGTQPVAVASDPAIGGTLVLSQGSVSGGSTGGNGSLEVVPDASSAGAFLSLPFGTTPLALAVDSARGRIDISQVLANGPNWDLQLQQLFQGNQSTYATTNLSVEPSTYGIRAGQDAAVLPLPNSTTVAVTDPGAPKLYGVDVANGSLAWTARLDGPAVGLAFDPSDGLILVATNGASTLVAVDPSTGTVRGTAILQENATGVAYDPLNQRAYVAENDKSSQVGGQVESFSASALLGEALVSGFGAALGGIAFLNVSGLIGVDGASTGLLYLLGQTISTPTLSASPTSLVVGQSFTLTSGAKGGFLPYNVSYTGLPPGCPSANTTHFVCAPVHSGTFTVTVHLQDLTGASVALNTTVVVAPPPVTPGINLASGTPVGGTVQSATLGENVTLSASVVSLGVTELGSATLLNWTVAPITNGTLDSSHGKTVTVSFFDTGELTVILTVFFEGTTNSSSVLFDVGTGTPTKTSGGGGGIPILDLILGAVAAVVIVGVVVGVVMMRRGGGGPPPSDEPAPTTEAEPTADAGTPPEGPSEG